MLFLSYYGLNILITISSDKKKSRIRETLNLSTCADRSINTKNIVCLFPFFVMCQVSPVTCPWERRFFIRILYNVNLECLLFMDSLPALYCRVSLTSSLSHAGDDCLTCAQLSCQRTHFNMHQEAAHYTGLPF